MSKIAVLTRGLACVALLVAGIAVASAPAEAATITQPTNGDFETLTGGFGTNSNALTGWTSISNAGQYNPGEVSFVMPGGNFGAIMHTQGGQATPAATGATFFGYASEAAMETAYGGANIVQLAGISQSITINNPGDYLQFTYDFFGGQRPFGIRDFVFLSVDDGSTVTSVQLLQYPSSGAWPLVQSHTSNNTDTAYTQTTYNGYGRNDHNGFQTTKFTFATTGTYTISFGVAEVVNNNGSAPALILDNVVINPEPGTIGLMAVGLLGMGALVRRRRRKSAVRTATKA